MNGSRMRTSMKHAILTVCIWMTITPLFSAVDDTEAGKLYQQAKKLTIALRWEEALQSFSKLIDTYPGSRYEDDAQFWIGYCLEKKGGSEMEAFMAFSDLIRKFPRSSRIQDALVHQISVTESLVRNGQEQFRDFLIEKLRDERIDVRQQAALSLARLGDKRALSVLESMFDDEDFGQEARLLAAKVTAEKPEAKTIPESKIQKPDQMDFETKAQKEMPAREKTPQEKWDDRFFILTDRHKYYRDMLRDDEKWTQDNLIDYGMWTILPTDQFAAYIALTGYDRKEWFRRYWTLRDPTPTTPENESLNEFYRRIEYANKRYGECWNDRSFQYLKDQYLREGWPHAPWDARGELYVKYGDPTYISIGGWQKEEWQYDRYSLDFTVTRYVTNIYQNAIEPGPMSQAIYSNQQEWVRANYILNQEFRYEHPYKNKPIKDIKLKIESGEGEHQGEVQISYSFSVKDLAIEKEKGQYTVKYLRHMVILDEAMHEVRRYETLRTVTGETKKELTDRKVIEEQIPVHLAPGTYRVALRIEDIKGKKLGLYVENITVVAK